MAGFSWAPSLEITEDDSSELVATPSGQTPTAKRQRRLTLTAMTGLICELSQECPNREPANLDLDKAEKSERARKNVQLQEGSEEVHSQRDTSPVKRLKRSRASISATATADVMATQAAKTLGKSSQNRVPGGKLSQKSSDSSDSTEEEEETLALRVRRAQAFECGALTVSELAGAPPPLRPPMGFPMQCSSPGSQQGELSPRSKLSFERGLRAAQVAAKVAAAMMPAEPDVSNTTHAPAQAAATKVTKVPPLGQKLRGGA